MFPIPSPAIMGILNVTPDSFSDGGLYQTAKKAVSHARQLVADGADIIDIGGESTRPGAKPVSEHEEMDRVLPVVEKLLGESSVKISVDTSRPGVMREAARLGVDLINDVRALQVRGALEVAAETGLPVCLMHMQGQPDTMQTQPDYADLIEEIIAFFERRINVCIKAGITKDKIVLDPGFGFGKTVQHNMMLINRLSEFTKLGHPLLVGVSRKSTINKILSPLSHDTLVGSVAGAMISVQNGASIVRVHDVKETRDALAICRAVVSEGKNLVS